MSQRCVHDRAEYREVADPGGLAVLSANFRDHSFVPHCHATYVLGVVDAGEGATTYQGRRHVAPTGAVMLINPGEVHTGAPASVERGWRYRMLYPSIALVERHVGAICGKEAFRPRFRAPVIHDALLATLVSDLHSALTSPTPVRSQHKLFDRTIRHLVTGHMAGVLDEDPRDPCPRPVTVAKAYLCARIAEPVRLTALAAHVALSPFYFSRLFKKHTGMAPYVWLEHARIVRAAGLLRLGRRVSEVAQLTGFSDQAHLTRRFKRVVGVPPGAFVRGLRRDLPSPLHPELEPAARMALDRRHAPAG
ncbi:MAG TPA: AraC family transcriptional regulator [Candidatus Nanopelagicales bacterium]|nr:AraC family transcriptional regulator [Candidatus Nanopelagicales bacterium]